MAHDIIGARRDEFRNRLETLAETPPLAVGLVDVDNFVLVNDRFGHDAGDRCIAAVERTLASSLPKRCAVARVGGDEIACAFPSTPPEEALILLEEVRQHLAEHEHPAGGDAGTLSVSIGIAALPQHVDLPDKLLAAADAALLRAKQEGRGRSAIYVDDRMVLKSNYYPKAQLAQLAKLSDRLGRTEASLLREALAALIDRHRGSSL